MPNRMTDRYNVTQKYLMTRGQAINFPAQYFAGTLRRNDVFGVVIDIPMSSEILTTMVCFINGAANVYFNNGGEYTGASQKYRNLVQAAHTLVANAGNLLPKCKRTRSYDLPKDRTNYIFLLTKGGVYKTEIKAGLIPEEEQELRTFYVLYQRVLNEIRNCQLKDEAERRNAAK
jgi:ATP adenylyltransferase/5',5'''-P-1,P-4-tetraphosphate phosphorylase II